MNIYFLQKEKIKEDFNNDDNIYYSLEIDKEKLYSFDIDNKILGQTLLELKGQIEKILGYDKIKTKCNASKEELDRIAHFHVDNQKTCDYCDLKFEHCYECIFKHDNYLERYLFREYKKRNITDRNFEEDLSKIKETHNNFEGCKPYCKFKGEKCFECALNCQSPLEQKFFLGAMDRGLGSELKLQVVIDRNGKLYDSVNEVDKHDILTIPDFYLEKENKKICLYTDGFTYHERTEDQAIRDRNIDRKLQNMGFEVMRYTTREVLNNIDNIISSIFNM